MVDAEDAASYARRSESASSRWYGWGFIHLLFWARPTWLDVLLMFTGTTFAIVAGLTYPVLGILFGKLIDDLNSSSCDLEDGSGFGAVRAKVLLIICVAIVQFVLIYGYMGSWTLFGERLVRRLRTQYLAALLRQETAYFETLSPGEVSARLDSDIRAIQESTSEKIGIVVTSVSYFLGAYGIAFALNAKLAALLFTMIPAYLLMGAVCSYLINMYNREISELTDCATSIASEALGNVKLVQAFCAEYRLESIFSGYLIQMQGAAKGRFITEAVQLGLLYFISYSANALAIWQGSKDIAASLADSTPGLTVGNVYTVIFVLVDGEWKHDIAGQATDRHLASFVITRIAPYIPIFAAGVSSSNHLANVIARQSRIDGTIPGQTQVISHVKGSIRLQDVTFRYPSRLQQVVLDQVSLHIAAGEMTAIVGMSGSGKSTVASLIPRLYDVEHGRILIDDQDIRDLDVRSLRNLVTVVEQSPSLLQCSIMENVALGLVGSLQHPHLQTTVLDGSVTKLAEAVRNGASWEDAICTDANLGEILQLIQRTTKLAGASSFVNRLQHGLATDVGHHGRLLSGGQTQRLGIARALIRDSPVLILDEATSSLDSTTEREIQATIEDYCKGKTIVCIAHRLSTIRNAAKVVVMGNGRVIEEGSYTDLIQKDGIFAEMLRLQDVEPLSQAPTPDTTSELGETDTGSSHQQEEDHKSSLMSKTIPKDIDFNEEAAETTPLLGSKLTGPLPESTIKGTSFWGTFPRVMSLARSERRYMVMGIVSASLAGMSSPASALAFGNMIGSMSPCNGPSAVRASGVLFGQTFMLLAVWDILVTTARGSSFGRVSERVLLTSRVSLFRSLFYQSVTWHESEGRSPNMLLSNLTSDTSSLSAMSGTLIGVSLSIIVNLGLGIILSHVVAWKIALVLLSAIPFLLASGYLRLTMLARFREKHQKAFAHSVAIAKDVIDHSHTVALFGLQDQSVRAYERSLEEPYKETLRTIIFGNFWLALSYGMSSLIYALAYWWGAVEVERGQYTQTQFFIVLPALLISAQQCGQLFTLAPDISRAGVAAKQIFKQLDIGPPVSGFQLTPEVQARSDNVDSLRSDIEAHQPYHPQPQPRTSHPRPGISISFKDVHFVYPARPNIPILQGLTLEIPSNQFCALTGPSGAGKSTLLSLIEGFYHPAQGSILLDGKPITATSSFRDNIALVPQESVLFNASIRFNVSLGFPPNETGTQQAIEEACRTANIHDTIARLPHGYDTIVGGSGSGLLSGGQKQRISLARALVRKPRLLLLDEATSALDAESERVWRDTVEGLMKSQATREGGREGNGLTIVAIAHRLSTVKNADRIFWIDAGRCRAMGTHEEMYGKCEGYRRAVEGQGLGLRLR